MKKVLAVLLAVVLCFSFSSTVFAADLIDEPAPTSGQICLSVKGAYLEAGGEYELPVAIISAYDPQDCSGDMALVLSFSLGVACDNDDTMRQKVEITGFEFTDEIKNREGFYEQDKYGNEDDASQVSAIIPCSGLLSTDYTQIGTVKVKVAEDIQFTSKDDVENALQITLTENIFGVNSADFADSEYYTSGKFAGTADYYNFCTSCMVVDTQGNYEDVGTNFILSPATCYQLPPVLPWTERIINLLKLWGYQIVSGLTSILSIAQTFLNPEA